MYYILSTEQLSTTVWYRSSAGAGSGPGPGTRYPGTGTGRCIAIQELCTGPYRTVGIRDTSK